MEKPDANTLLVTVAGACIVAAFAFFAFAFYQRTQAVDNTNHQICVAVSNINAVITQTLQRSLADIPKLAYYKNHPDELALQRREIMREIVQFRPRTCN